MSGTVGDVTPVAVDRPFVDEHTVLVRAPAAAVWRALGRSLPRSRPAELYVALVGGDPRSTHGDPLVEGSALPGFAVREAQVARRLVLAGRHRFSTYTLTFTLDPRDDGTQLAARSEATFPGLPGRLYRAAVIGSGGHRVLVRRWLRQIGRAAEAAGR